MSAMVSLDFYLTIGVVSLIVGGLIGLVATAIARRTVSVGTRSISS